MLKYATIKRVATVTFAMSLLILIGSASEATAQQRDPFAKPGWARTKEPGRGPAPKGAGGEKKAPEFTPGIPSIEQRIEYFKRIREDAATSGQPLPKVTSVLSLDEMQVTGIFKTPRGYAAMVEATPIKLSYTIYPGEKFFDGQLVAVEENRLTFRKVTKVAKNKFSTTVEHKPLRRYTQRELIQGTAPADAETASKGNAPGPKASEILSTTNIVSPLDEVNNQPDESTKTAAKPTKKPVRVARKKN